jgi:N utilization substance protein B
LLGGRRKAREIVFRVLYETEVTGEDTLEALEFALGRYHLTEDGREHAVRTVRFLMDHREELDARLRPRLSNWDLGRLSTVVRSILRLALAELLGTPDVPARVILDEAVELAKKYGEETADAFVNGVLDPLAQAARPGELDRRGNAS